jgi:hypothetical protein
MIFLQNIAWHIDYVVGIEVGEGDSGVAEVVFYGVLVLIANTI